MTMFAYEGSMTTHLKYCGGEAERFWAKVDKGGPNGCWLWTGCKNEWGYGLASWAGRKNLRVHRISYEIASGTIPAGKLVLHKCDTPACLRPDHLFLGTDADNMLDKQRKGRIDRTLTREQAREARQIFLAGGVTKSHLARKYGLCSSTMGKLLDGRIYKDAL
jgi:hypothetical protein